MDVAHLRPDTASYLYFDPSRSIGYPAFLWTVRAVTGDVLNAVPIQMALLAAALFVLGASFHDLARRPWLSVGFQLLLLGSPEMWLASASLITEALATALVALWCAQMLRLVKRASLRRVIILCVVAGAGMLVRPSLLPLFAGTAVAALATLGGRRGWLGAASAGGALVAFWAVNPATNFMLHGSPAGGSPLARGVLQHTLYCAPRSAPSSPDAAFVEAQAARVRRYVMAAPPDVRPALKQLYSGELRFGLIIPVLGRRHGMQAGWQTDPIIMRVARERIASNASCYGRSVVTSYYRLATYDAGGTPGQIRQIKSFLADDPPIGVPSAPLLPADESLAVKAANELREAPARPGRQSFDPPREKPWILLLGARFLYGAAATLGILAMLLLPLRDRAGRNGWRAIAAVASFGVAFHGVLAVTAFVELPLMRYTVPVWPVTCSMIGTFAALFIRRPRSNHDARCALARAAPAEPRR